jgi:hypothetical protein
MHNIYPYELLSFIQTIDKNISSIISKKEINEFNTKNKTLNELEIEIILLLEPYVILAVTQDVNSYFSAFLSTFLVGFKLGQKYESWSIETDELKRML